MTVFSLTRTPSRFLLRAVFATVLLAASAGAQTVDEAFLSKIAYRNLGPYRGGRVTAVAGVASDPMTYYMGSTGGGVWKTTDGGTTWNNISDEFFKAGSVGAVAVASSDPNVIYVGMGTADPRGNVSPGNGMYKSTDAGKTWTHTGLPEAGQIGRIQIHPDNPDLVYVAVLGHIFGPNEERGVYRSKDGGANWERVHYVSDKTGAIDLSMDVRNPRQIYAAMWAAERKPFTMLSGSEDGGIWKTSDGGDTWTKLEKGLPEGMKGKIGVSVSAANPNRVFALIEAPEGKGGVYRSDDAGDSFTKINSDRAFLQRAWYYTKIHADPVDENTVYILNVLMYRSTDGGKTYSIVMTPHPDNHGLWINPENNQTMIESNDGGANVTYNGGKTWSSIYNQPTGEFYRVTTDHRFPYWVYGAQQDNTTIRIASRTNGLGITPKDWHQVGGCESGHIAIDPRDPDANIVYAGCYGGSITRYDHRSGEWREITTYPQLALGQAPVDLKYRFQWNAPIRISPHDPEVLYHTSNYVHRSTDEGHSWTLISPDLTVNNEEMQDYGGGPITRDNTGVEVYGTVFAFEESPLTKGLLWTGSDDGRVHVSKNGGVAWEEVTPPGIPEFATVNAIDPSTHDPARAQVTVFRYRYDDFTPYVFQTNDYGQTWKRLTTGDNGIPDDHFVRVVREDPNRKGLLYAGTEFGMYVSFDDGDHWQSLQANLPVTPVTDLQIKEKDLVLSTQGRAFWVLDDLTPLYQLTDTVLASQRHLFDPKDGFRTAGPGFDIPTAGVAKNPPAGVVINYYLAPKPESGDPDAPSDADDEATEPTDEVRLEILDASGNVVRSLSSKTPEEKAPNLFAAIFGGGAPPSLAPAEEGMNQWIWDLTYPDARVAEGTIMWGSGQGPRVAPGIYRVRLTVDDWSATQDFEVKKDPRIQTSQADYESQVALALEVRDLLSETYDTLRTVRSLKEQIADISSRLHDAGMGEGIDEAANAAEEKLTAIEVQLYQTKNEAFQDPLNFQPMLDNQIAGLYAAVLGSESKPTAGSYERYEELKSELAGYRSELEAVTAGEVATFNTLVAERSQTPVIAPKFGPAKATTSPSQP